MHACYRLSPDAVERLVAKGADVTLNNVQGPNYSKAPEQSWSMLEWAASNPGFEADAERWARIEKALGFA